MNLKLRPGRGKSLGKSLMKFLVTLGLLGVIAWKINIKEVVELSSRLKGFPLAIAVLLGVGAVILSAYKWQLLLIARGWGLKLPLLTREYFISLFVNNFLPSSIGGDLLRIYRIGKKINNQSEAAASVILERVLAAIGLALVALIAVIPNSKLLGHITGTILIFYILCLVIIFVLIKPQVFKPLKKIPWQWWQQVAAKLKEVGEIIHSYHYDRRVIARVIIYSSLFQLLIVLMNYYLIKAMGIGFVNIWHCALLVPVISAVSMIPVSINGLGVREGAYLVLFGQLGLSSGQCLTLSLLFFLIVTLLSLLGGLMMLLERNKDEYVITG